MESFIYERVDHENGDIITYLNDQVHSYDPNEPAVTTALGTLIFFKHGKLHREVGPAFICPVTKVEEYWLDGFQYSRKEWEKLAANFICHLISRELDTVGITNLVKELGNVLAAFSAENILEPFKKYIHLDRIVKHSLDRTAPFYLILHDLVEAHARSVKTSRADSSPDDR